MIFFKLFVCQSKKRKKYTQTLFGSNVTPQTKISSVDATSKEIIHCDNQDTKQV